MLSLQEQILSHTWGGHDVDARAFAVVGRLYDNMRGVLIPCLHRFTHRKLGSRTALEIFFACSMSQKWIRYGTP